MIFFSEDNNIRAIFIHVPKTAGNSIQNLIFSAGLQLDHKTVNKSQDGFDRFEIIGEYTKSKHQRLAQYYSINSELRLLPVFVCVRKPFERLVSLYFSPNRWFNDSKEKSISNLNEPCFNENTFISLVNRHPNACTYVADYNFRFISLKHKILYRIKKESAFTMINKMPSSIILDLRNRIKSEKLTVLRSENLSKDIIKISKKHELTITSNRSMSSDLSKKILESTELRNYIECQTHHIQDLDVFY